MLVLSPAVPCSAVAVADVLGDGKGQVGSRGNQGSLRVSKCAGFTSSVLWRQQDTVVLFPLMPPSCPSSYSRGQVMKSNSAEVLSQSPACK